MTTTTNNQVMPAPYLHIDTENPENGITEMNMCCENGVMDIIPHLKENQTVFEGAAFLFYNLDCTAQLLAEEKISELSNTQAAKVTWMSAQVQMARFLINQCFEFDVVDKGLFETYKNAYRVNKPDGFSGVDFLASVADTLEDLFLQAAADEAFAENPDIKISTMSTRFAALCGTACTAIRAMKSFA
ncbi:hypothetical protein [Synechococcus sp. MIT S9507]|uniref:hypothetical protein n=1 Tax=Synechococcus sp. MIT S9507 TaxID=3082544 RepID=UPI0039B56BC2